MFNFLLSSQIRADLETARRHGTKHLQRLNESLIQFPLPWDDLTKLKFRAIENSMINILEKFEKLYEKWRKLIRELDDQQKARVEEELFAEWKDKPEYDDLIYELNNALQETNIYMKLKVNDNFQGEVPTNNSLPYMAKQGMSLLKDPLSFDTAKPEAVITVCCAVTNKINTKYKEKLRVSDAKASKSSLVANLEHVMDIQIENSESSTAQIVPIVQASRSKRTQTFKKLNVIPVEDTLMVEKADCKKVASGQAISAKEAKKVPTTIAEFQRQNKFDRPPSSKIQQQTTNIDENSSEKLDQVKPIFMKEDGPFSSREILEHTSFVPEKFPLNKKIEKVEPKIVNQIDNFGTRAVLKYSNSVAGHPPTTGCRREGPPAYGKKLVEQFDKPWDPNNSTSPSQLQEVKVSLVPLSKEIKSWKDKPPECNWEANTLTPSTELRGRECCGESPQLQ